MDSPKQAAPSPDGPFPDKPPIKPLEEPPPSPIATATDNSGNEIASQENPFSGTSNAARQSSRQSGFDWAAFFWLLCPALIIALSVSMTTSEGRAVFLPFIEVPVPETCMTRARFGVECPGCGLTRSFIHAAHGRIVESLQLNWVGLILFCYTLAQIPLALTYWSLPLSKRLSSKLYVLIVTWNERLAVVFTALLVFRWGTNLLLGLIF